MQHLEVSGAVRHIYIYICVCVCVVRQLRVNSHTDLYRMYCSPLEYHHSICSLVPQIVSVPQVHHSKFYAQFSFLSCVLYFPSISNLLVLRSVLFSDITERSVVMPYRLFLTHEDGMDRLSQNVSMASPIHAA